MMETVAKIEDKGRERQTLLEHITSPAVLSRSRLPSRRRWKIAVKSLSGVPPECTRY